MRLPILLRTLALGALALLAFATPSPAGQVRVDVGAGGGFSFAPATVSLNQGDHVVWVWVTTGHNVVSGDACASDGFFLTNIMMKTATVHPAFSWKSNMLSAGLNYFCEPHCPGMEGTVIVSASGVPVADFRITEVQMNAAGGLDLVEITNVGAASGDLGRYRFAAGGDTATVPQDSFVVPSQARVVVHVNAAGPQTAPSALYLPHLASLPAVGSLALYVPNTASGQTLLTNTSQIIDFVQWGAATQANESIAVAAGLWTTAEFVTFSGDATRSIEFCGAATDRGSAHWSEISATNFGSDGDCVTPTLRTTWGKIKTIYR